MKAVTMRDGHYIVIVPEARVTLVMTQAEFVQALQRGKHWKRRQVQAQREVEAAPAAAEKRARLTQDTRS